MSYLVLTEAELECLATWKFNGGDWLYVKYGHNDYRCMVSFTFLFRCCQFGHCLPLFILYREEESSVLTAIHSVSRSDRILLKRAGVLANLTCCD